MIIRTISQLPEISALTPNDYIEVSQSTIIDNATRYVSKKAKVGDIEKTFEGTISVNIANTFDLYESQPSAGSIQQPQPLSLRNEKARIDSISAENVDLYGVKNLHSIPEITLTSLNEYSKGHVTDNRIPNIAYTKELIQNNAGFIGDNYKIDADPNTDSSPSFMKDSSQFMHWHIDDNGNDSTKWMDPEAGNARTQVDGVQCKHSGFLTIFGWLADNGHVLPQDCWVGLYGRMRVVDESTGGVAQNKWVLLQVVPWVRGYNATQLQYVGFNLPVKKGLWLKIKTGFAVNGHVGGFQDSRSITYALNQPNSFTGYIVRGED